MEKNFLEQYKTHDKPEAKKAAEREEVRSGEKGIVQDRSKRIEAYIKRLEEIFLHPDDEKRARRTDIFKEKFLYPNVIVKEENFPESYFEYQKEVAEKRGMGEITFRPEDKQQEIASVQEKQRKSLDAWIDHLTSDDCHYPADIKYFVAQGILKTGKFDEKAYRFNDREKATTAPFRQIDHEALSMVMGALEAVHHQKDTSPYRQELLDLIQRNKSFGSMYAETMRYLDTEAGKDKALEITDGAWRVFPKGSDPQELVEAFEGKRAYLCLGNIGAASGYLERGDMQVYFSNNRAGEPVWPRVAIAVNPKEGAYELRGTYNPNEDIDPEIAKTNVIKERLATIQNGESFAKKDTDMKQLTAIYEKCFSVDRKTKEKVSLNPTLSKDDLSFLYEINGTIEGFGYQKDPRIAKIIQERGDVKKDLATLFDCTRDQISTDEREAISGGIVFHYGDLDLSGLTSAKGLTLPKSVGGYLDLGGLTLAKGLTLPESVGGSLWLHRLTSAEGLTLPKSVGGGLLLNGLTSTEGLTLPKSVGGYLDLGGLTSAKGLTLPKSVSEGLDLNRLTSAKGLTLPESVSGGLYLSGLTSAKGLTLPKSFGGSLGLSGLTSAEGLTLPESVGGHLDLRGLTSAEGLTLPESVSGGLWLNGLTSAEREMLRMQYPNLNIGN